MSSKVQILRHAHETCRYNKKEHLTYAGQILFSINGLVDYSAGASVLVSVVVACSPALASASSPRTIVSSLST